MFLHQTEIYIAHLVTAALGDNKNFSDASNIKPTEPKDEVPHDYAKVHHILEYVYEVSWFILYFFEQYMQVEPLTDISTNCQGSASELPAEFPKTVERVLNIGCSPTTMDFHPVNEALLLG